MIEIVSATRLAEREFFDTSPLGLSLLRLDDRRLTRTSVAFENRTGLSEIFNARIFSPDSAEILVFIHDDVWIMDDLFCDRVTEGLVNYDVIGVAGNRRRVPGQPMWWCTDARFQFDSPSNLSGSVAHGRPPNAEVTVYGDWPAPCELIDGLFLAARKPALSTTGVRFDPRFAFDFYDMDFCRQARKMALVLGTWPMSLCHESDGVRNSATWLKAYETYLDKWKG